MKPWGTHTAEDRFWRKVEVRSGECWNWIGAKTSNGYGNFWDGERNVLPHRYVLGFIGIDAGELEVDHLCFNRLCVNPSHLEVVTRAVNAQRQEAVHPRPRRANGQYGRVWNQSALDGLVSQLNA